MINHQSNIILYQNNLLNNKSNPCQGAKYDATKISFNSLLSNLVNSTSFILIPLDITDE